MHSQQEHDRRLEQVLTHSQDGRRALWRTTAKCYQLPLQVSIKVTSDARTTLVGQKTAARPNRARSAGHPMASLCRYRHRVANLAAAGARGRHVFTGRYRALPITEDSGVEWAS
jgi:hypothetical protein